MSGGIPARASPLVDDLLLLLLSPLVGTSSVGWVSGGLPRAPSPDTTGGRVRVPCRLGSSDRPTRSVVRWCHALVSVRRPPAGAAFIFQRASPYGDRPRSTAHPVPQGVCYNGDMSSHQGARHRKVSASTPATRSESQKPVPTPATTFNLNGQTLPKSPRSLPSDHPLSDLLTPPSAAPLAGRDRMTMTRWINTGKIRVLTIDGHQFVSRNEVLALAGRP